MKESDLYPPIRNHFHSLGYRVNGEVKDCDVTAMKGEELIIVELKLSLTVDLLVQAAKRLRLTDMVYIAVPRPKRTRSKRWRDACHLVRRLELGLITVAPHAKGDKIEFVHHPAPFDRKASLSYGKKKRAQLVREIEGRSADYNVGGSNKLKIMTAYKESCIHIAVLLDRHGPLSPKSLKELGAGDKTPLILQKNYYGWYDRVKRGVYELTEKGKREMLDYPALLETYSTEEGSQD